MAKAIYICRRNPAVQQQKRDLQLLDAICKQLQPENVSSLNHKVYAEEDIAYGIMNTQPSFKMKGHSLLLGILFDGTDHWDKLFSEFPDGNYALFRNNQNHVEAVSDILATRTIWYYHDDDLFIASTSQRAVILFLGSFEFNERVIPWMLSSGSLGPEYSWDSRIKKLPPDSSVRLNKKEWSLSTHQHPIHINPGNGRDKHHKKKLKNAIEQTIRSCAEMDLNHWPVTLSGGYDSRGILCYLRKYASKPESLRSITHGLLESLSDKKSDAYIAQKLANRVGSSHTFYPTDSRHEKPDRIIDRFLLAGEGRVDHLSAYMDGMEMWRCFTEEEQIDGIIRGDVVFHPFKVLTERFVRYRLGCTNCSDYKNLESLAKRFGFAKQELPEYLKKARDETVFDWRDRLYQGFRVPVIHGALNEVKLSFVEVVNPLLSKKIIHTVREFPERLRKDKTIYEEIVRSISPDIPYAKKESTYSTSEALKKIGIIDLLKKELDTGHAREIFSQAFIQFIFDQMDRNTDTDEKMMTRLMTALKKKFHHIFFSSPEFILRYYEKKKAKLHLDRHTLAFRIYIIIRMNKILKEDSVR